jgi:hypothetical protein
MKDDVNLASTGMLQQALRNASHLLLISSLIRKCQGKPHYLLSAGDDSQNFGKFADSNWASDLEASDPEFAKEIKLLGYGSSSVVW